MNLKYTLPFLLFLFFSDALSAQKDRSGSFEFGVSLFSFNRDPNTWVINDPFPFTSANLFNGFIFKYYPNNKYAFRLRNRIIGRQSIGSNPRESIDIGNRFRDHGWELAVGCERILFGEHWQWNFGIDAGYTQVKDNSYYNRRISAQEKFDEYYSINLIPTLGLRIQASNHLSFLLETNLVFGYYQVKYDTLPQVDTAFGYFWNPINIFAATYTFASN